MSGLGCSIMGKLAGNKKATLLGLCITCIIALLAVHITYTRRIPSIKNAATKLSDIASLPQSEPMRSEEAPPSESVSRKTTPKPPAPERAAVTTTPKPKPAGPAVIDIPDPSKFEQSLMPSAKQKGGASGSSNGKQRLPDAMVIGTPACGTTPLYEFLRVHPKIEITPSELLFFTKDSVYAKGVDWYIKQMPVVSDDTVLVEKAHHSAPNLNAPERLKSVNPNCKIIYVICDATFRAFAQVLDMMNQNDTTKIFLNGVVNKTHKAVIYSQYSVHLERWRAIFPKDRIYVLESDMLLRNPIEEMGHIEDFLGVSTQYNPQFIYFNSSAFTYCVKHQGVNHCLKPNAIAKAPNEFPHTTVYKVREYLRPFSDKLFEMVNHKYNWL